MTDTGASQTLTRLPADLSTLGSAPISAEAPAGSSIRAEQAFESLSDEVAKQEQVKAEDVDWEKVVALSASILANQSKDLLVAVYFCRGQFSTAGFDGLHIGLGALTQMVNAYWDSMEPPLKRMRGRAAALDWLMEKLADAVTRMPANAEQRPMADQCIQQLDALEQALSDHGVSLDGGPLLRALKVEAHFSNDIAVSDERPDAGDPQATAAATDPEQALASTPSETTPKAPRSPAKTPQKVDPELRRMIRRCSDEMLKLAGVWLERDLRDTRAYRYTRLGIWAAVERLPRNQDGMVDLPPPPHNRLNTVHSLYEQKRFPEFVVDAESIVAKHMFWLDGHRLVATALSAMGEQFEAAAQAVGSEVLSFVDRIPEVIDLRFSDGTAFASPSTRAWLEQSRLSSSTAMAGETPLDSGIAEAWGSMASSASELADGGDFAAVAALFAEKIRRSPSQRQRFQWRLTEAGFYYRYGRDAVVLGLVDGLLVEMDRFGLPEWEPELAQAVAELGVRCAERLARSESTDYVLQLKQRSFELLCRLDPASALKISG